MNTWFFFTFMSSLDSSRPSCMVFYRAVRDWGLEASCKEKFLTFDF